MKIFRTIHPVGQGAFYSEEFMCEKTGDSALIVYDCGSTDTVQLKCKISSFFAKRKVIDILFISHFDNDHVNGIAEIRNLGVKIKTVVVPLIDKNDRWFYICCNNIDTKNAIDSPYAFFGADKVISIMPVEEDIEKERPEPYIIENNENTKNLIPLPSGTPISSAKMSEVWCYIPFNFDEKNRRSDLKNGLEKMFMDKGFQRKIEDLMHDDEFLEKYRKDINKEYNKIQGGSNKCSLIVYSGATTNVNKTFTIIPFLVFRPEDYNGQELIYAEHDCEGCLYLGDTDLNQKGKSNINILDQLTKKLQHHTDRIGTIQLPHHGSKHNFKKSLLTINNNKKIVFASYGTPNKYKHPHKEVVNFVKKNGIYYGISVCITPGLTELVCM